MDNLNSLGINTGTNWGREKPGATLRLPVVPKSKGKRNSGKKMERLPEKCAS